MALYDGLGIRVQLKRLICYLKPARGGGGKVSYCRRVLNLNAENCGFQTGIPQFSMRRGAQRILLFCSKHPARRAGGPSLLDYHKIKPASKVVVHHKLRRCGNLSGLLRFSAFPGDPHVDQPLGEYAVLGQVVVVFI